MNINDFRQAQYILKRIDELRRLREEIEPRDVDFCEGDSRRSLGRMQVDDRANDELRAAMKSAALAWFDMKIAEQKEELTELGVVFEEEAAAE